MNRRHPHIPATHSTQRRRGFTTPATAVALLVAMMGLALIIDRVWLETAKLELATAAESAALAAAAELASDDSLLPQDTSDLRITNAREVAAWIAAENYVGGAPVQLNTDSEGDIRFGNLVQQTEGIQFVETSTNPTTVVVTTLRTRANNNPVALFLSGIIGLPFGDVAARVEASVNNNVMGLRPIVGTSIPALPIAIWETDSTGQRLDTWQNMIRSGTGPDQYAFDSETHEIIAGTDGIPEMVIHSLGSGTAGTTPNVQLLDLGTQLTDSAIVRQIQSGISVDDLANLGGEILIGQGATVSYNCSPQFTSAQANEYQNLVGQRRICLLYSTTSTQQQSSTQTATCTEVVCVRVMAVSVQSDGSCAITVQPTVMTSKTAILTSEPTPTSVNEDSLSNELSNNVSDALTNDVATSTVNSQSTTTTNAIPNPYLYKLRLTY